jgi:hypothetical protein
MLNGRIGTISWTLVYWLWRDRYFLPGRRAINDGRLIRTGWVLYNLLKPSPGSIFKFIYSCSGHDLLYVKAQKDSTLCEIFEEVKHSEVDEK